MAEGVGEDEGVEAIVLGRCHSIALPGPGGDPGRHREHGMASGLHVFDQQPLGALQGDRWPGRSSNMSNLALISHSAESRFLTRDISTWRVVGSSLSSTQVTPPSIPGGDVSICHRERRRNEQAHEGAARAGSPLSQDPSPGPAASRVVAEFAD